VNVHEVDECAREHCADAKMDTPPRLRAAAVARLSGKQLAPVRTSGKRTRQAAEVPYARADRALVPRNGSIRSRPEGRRRSANRASSWRQCAPAASAPARPRRSLTHELIELWHRADGIQAASTRPPEGRRRGARAGQAAGPSAHRRQRTRPAAEILMLEPIELHHHAAGIQLHPLPPEGGGASVWQESWSQCAPAASASASSGAPRARGDRPLSPCGRHAGLAEGRCRSRPTAGRHAAFLAAFLATLEQPACHAALAPGGGRHGFRRSHGLPNKALLENR
jgi:hypothetical protein